MPAAKKEYEVEGNPGQGYRLMGEVGALTGRFKTEDDAKAAYEAAKKLGAARRAAEAKASTDDE